VCSSDLAEPDKAGSQAFSSSVGKEQAPDIEPGIRALCDAMTSRFDELIAQWGSSADSPTAVANSR